MLGGLLRRLWAAWRAFLAPQARIPAKWEEPTDDEPFANVREFHPVRRRP